MMPSLTSSLAFIGDVGGGEMILILIVILLLFGGQRMPELAKGLGKSIREFKKATTGVEDQIKRALEEDPVGERTPAAQAPFSMPPAAATTPAAPAPAQKNEAAPPPPAGAA
jgi:TatA/E family protein of Tat protein translocase